MNPRQIAKGAPYCLATTIEECPFERFWVVLVDCNGEGIEVYQSEDVATLGEPNSWMRLKRFCEENGFSIANMAYATKSLDPNQQINFDPMADGYFYTKRCRKLLGGFTNLNGYSDFSEGFGELKGDVLTIYWQFSDGRREKEERRISEMPKSHTMISLIRK